MACEVLKPQGVDQRWHGHDRSAATEESEQDADDSADDEREGDGHDRVQP